MHRAVVGLPCESLNLVEQLRIESWVARAANVKSEGGHHYMKTSAVASAVIRRYSTGLLGPKRKGLTDAASCQCVKRRGSRASISKAS